MENREKLWESYYQKKNTPLPKFDNWLEKYLKLINKDSNLLELGCGFGLNSELLIKNGFNVTSTDISKSALIKFKDRVPEAQISYLNLENPLEYTDESFGCVIADLCLHYFDENITKRIFSEINRVLLPKGILLFRVNSHEDINHGAGQGEEIEEGFYKHNGHYKRFFTERMIKNFTQNWKIQNINNYELHRYEKPKIVYEICIRKN